jgi:hypothetical protein
MKMSGMMIMVRNGPSMSCPGEEQGLVQGMDPGLVLKLEMGQLQQQWLVLGLDLTKHDSKSPLKELYLEPMIT